MRAKGMPCPDGAREHTTVATGRDRALVRWVLEQVDARLAAGGDRLTVMWAVVFTASVSADSDAVLGAVVRAVVAADEARCAVLVASPSVGGAR